MGNQGVPLVGPLVVGAAAVVTVGAVAGLALGLVTFVLLLVLRMRKASQ